MSDFGNTVSNCDPRRRLRGPGIGMVKYQSIGLGLSVGRGDAPPTFRARPLGPTARNLPEGWRGGSELYVEVLGDTL